MPKATAAAKPIDPVFAAIERHRAANAAFNASCNPADEVWAAAHGRKVTQADEDAYYAANAAEEHALSDLLETVPITVAGIRALLEYLSKFDDIAMPSIGLVAVPLLRSPILAGAAIADATYHERMREEAAR